MKFLILILCDMMIYCHSLHAEHIEEEVGSRLPRYTPDKVSPTIGVGESVVGGYQGEFVIIECEVSAWPEPVNYWEKDGRLLAPGARHQIQQVAGREIYKYRMILNVTLVSHDDVGTYYCVSKNEMGTTRAEIQVYMLGVVDACTCNGHSEMGLGECKYRSGGSPWCFINQNSSCSDLKAFGNLHTSSKACAVWEEWSSWSECSCAGMRTRTRTCSFGGNLCEGEDTQNQNCNSTCCSCNGALHGGHGECRDKFEGKPWCFINQGANCSDTQQFASFFTSFQACSDREKIMVKGPAKNPPSVSGECGVISEPVRCPPQEIAFGGNKSCAERSPWNVVIQRTERSVNKQRISVHCGGTLISARFVLSAAHCFWSNTHEDKSCPKELRSLTAEQCRIQGCPSSCRRVVPAGVTVFLGVTHVEGHGHISRGVARLEIHPGWDKTASFPGSSGHDLALLQLDKPVTFSDRIKPVCLPPLGGSGRTLDHGTVVHISGLGITKDSDRDVGGSDIIQHVFLNTLAQTACQIGHMAVTGDQLCAIGAGGANVCSGDSGSGLVVEEGGKHVMVGVAATSGVSCGDQVPSSYTNLLSGSKLSWVYSRMCRTDSVDVVDKMGSNQACILPFTYTGITYQTCTTVEDSRPWCSIKVNEKGEHVSVSEDGRPTWGHCEYSCPLSPGSKLEDAGRVCKTGETCVLDSICPEAQDLWGTIRGGEITKQEKKELVKKYRAKLCNKKPRGFCCSRST